jgi:hypothetical protein
MEKSQKKSEWFQKVKLGWRKSEVSSKSKTGIEKVRPTPALLVAR